MEEHVSKRAPLPDDVQKEYFGVQADWGMTKHMGGLKATERLIALCRAGPGSRVLVVGSGVGVTACLLAGRYRCMVTGIDLSAEMVRRARARTGRKGLTEQTRFLVADAQDLPFEEETFDAVLCESVNAFVPDKRKAMDQYIRVTRPGGCIGFNEVTWLKPPPDELERYLTRIMGAQFLSAENWCELFDDRRLTAIAAEVFHTGVLSQWKEEMRQFESGDFCRAWCSFFIRLVSGKETRRFTMEALRFPAGIFHLFDYFGYGIYTGRKVG